MNTFARITLTNGQTIYFPDNHPAAVALSDRSKTEAVNQSCFIFTQKIGTIHTQGMTSRGDRIGEGKKEAATRTVYLAAVPEWSTPDGAPNTECEKAAARLFGTFHAGLAFDFTPEAA